MSFTPVFAVLTIPRDSSSITIQDTTPSSGSGYGVTNGPANSSAITLLVLSVTAYGDTAVNGVIATGYAVDDLGTAIKYTVSVPDGVVIVKLHYGELKTVGVTVSDDRLTLTISNAEVIFEGVTFVAIDGTEIVEVTDISGSTVTLASALPGSATSLTQIYKFYTAQLRSLILRRADKSSIKEIDKISLYDSNADLRKPMLKIILKEAAEREYTLGNYAKADEAARLAGGTQPVYTSTCLTCE